MELPCFLGSTKPYVTNKYIFFCFKKYFYVLKIIIHLFTFDSFMCIIHFVYILYIHTCILTYLLTV